MSIGFLVLACDREKAYRWETHTGTCAHMLLCTYWEFFHVRQFFFSTKMRACCTIFDNSDIRRKNLDDSNGLRIFCRCRCGGCYVPFVIRLCSVARAENAAVLLFLLQQISNNWFCLYSVLLYAHAKQWYKNLETDETTIIEQCFLCACDETFALNLGTRHPAYERFVHSTNHHAKRTIKLYRKQQSLLLLTLIDFNRVEKKKSSTTTNNPICMYRSSFLPSTYAMQWAISLVRQCSRMFVRFTVLSIIDTLAQYARIDCLTINLRFIFILACL